MAIQVSFFTLFARRSTFASDEEVRSLCGAIADDLVVWRCMLLDDVDHVVQRLAKVGVHLSTSDQGDGDLAVADMNSGLLRPCNWLDIRSTPLGLQAAMREAPART